VNVLVIDDDTTFNAVLVRALARRDYAARGATTAADALAAAREEPPDAVVLDLNLGADSGLQLIRPLLELAPACRIVVLTGYASIATAVEAVKLGATQYFAKPIEVDSILSAFEEVSPQALPSVSSDPLSVSRLEWEHIHRVLHDNKGNISATARALKMHRRTLQRKLSKRPAKD